jgi:3-hydroxyacyl-CoA dehydrogenase
LNLFFFFFRFVSPDSLLQKAISKGKATPQERDETLRRIKPTTKLEDINSADFVIEAVSENYDLKSKIFSDMSKLTQKDSILATNTSSISITKIASVTNRPEKVHNNSPFFFFFRSFYTKHSHSALSFFFCFFHR